MSQKLKASNELKNFEMKVSPFYFLNLVIGILEIQSQDTSSIDWHTKK